MNEPSVFPTLPFTRADLGEVPEHVLVRAVADGHVRRVLRDVYVTTAAGDDHDVRFHALRRVLGPGHIACDRTAAWLHGIDLVTKAGSDPVPPVEVCCLRGSEKTRRTGVHGRERDLAPEDVVEVHGVRVTSPLRTALDLGCILRRREALAALDQFRRSFGFSVGDLERPLQRYGRRRGVVQLRELIPLTDPRAGSPRESWTRLEIRDAGLPAPVPQLDVEVGDEVMRLDLAYPGRLVAVEYDGLEFHTSPDQLEHDRHRRDLLRAQGWTVIVVRRGDFTGYRLDQWIFDLREALERTGGSTPLRW